MGRSAGRLRGIGPTLLTTRSRTTALTLIQRQSLAKGTSCAGSVTMAQRCQGAGATGRVAFWVRRDPVGSCVWTGVCVRGGLGVGMCPTFCRSDL